MTRIIVYGIAVGIVIHGLIHLMGFVAYWPLGTIAELPYKTALLDGRWEVGSAGMRLFSVLWLAAAVGFVLAALGLVLGWDGWIPLMLGAILVSLVITGLDWQVAFRGAIIDVVLLAALVLLPRVSGWLPTSFTGEFLR